MTGRRGLAIAKIISATLLFSINPTLFRLVELPPAEIFWFVNILALFVILFVLSFTGDLRNLLTAFRSEAGQFLLLGALFSANNVLFISAIKRTTIANATFTHFLAPVFVLVLGFLLLGEKVERRGVISLVLSLGGLGMILGSTGLVAGNQEFIGVSMGTASALFFAYEIVQKEKLVKSTRALIVVALYLFVSVFLLIPFVSPSKIVTIRSSDWMVLLVSGVVVSGIGITLFTSGLRDIRAEEAGVLSFLEPLGAVVWGAALLAEIPPFPTLLGGFCILTGTYLIVTRHFPLDI